MGHSFKGCRFPIRCLACFNYGHLAKHCLVHTKPRLMWKPKIHAPGPNATAAGPSIQWRPKKPLEQEVNSENALEIVSQSPRGTQEADPAHSQSSYITPPDHSSPSHLVGVNENPHPLLPQPPQYDAMANFACDPVPFLPFGAHVEDGWQRSARSRVALGGEPPR